MEEGDSSITPQGNALTCILSKVLSRLYSLLAYSDISSMSVMNLGRPSWRARLREKPTMQVWEGYE